jgi:hypothetical protein
MYIYITSFLNQADYGEIISQFTVYFLFKSKNTIYHVNGCFK